MSNPALQWRQPQLSNCVHLAEPGAHRALCGADVLTAFTDSDAPRHMACAQCLREAECSGHRRPPFTAERAADTHTMGLFRA